MERKKVLSVEMFQGIQKIISNKFKESLQLDNNGNLNADVIKYNGDSHTLCMSNTQIIKTPVRR